MAVTNQPATTKHESSVFQIINAGFTKNFKATDKNMSETFSTGQSPFREAIDTTRFFPGGERRAMLESIKTAVVGSVGLIILSGDEGSGKTMLCHMVKEELPDEYVYVFFPDMLESFEDVTRQIAQEMKITFADGIAVGDIRELLVEVRERLIKRKEKMLLIFDQAERIYLATLERIRKMLDLVNQNGICLQILLSGRDGLMDNLEQLTMCNFEGAEEKQFTLAPLDSSATYSYLNFCMRGEGDNEVFSLETSEKILLAAEGNIRRTNALAEKLVQLKVPESSFMVLLDNVRDTVAEKHRSPWDSSYIKELYSTYKEWVLVAGACVVILFLVLLWRVGRSPEVQEKKPVPEIEKTLAEFRTAGKKEEEIEQKIKTVKEETALRDQKKAQKKKIASLSPEHSKVKVEDITVKKSVKEKPPESSTITDKVPVITKSRSRASEKSPLSEQEQNNLVEKIFKDRTAAAAKWLVGGKNTHYTIQLMVLASEGAEGNLKKMLATKQYQGLAENLYILRSAASTPSIIVFYGEYETMVDARKARKALPEFLLKHDPYAISIRGAINKALGG